MASIYIQADDLVLCCPHCSVEIQEITVNRIWEPVFECEECGCYYELSVSISET